MKLSIVVPVYNEDKNLPELSRWWGEFVDVVEPRDPVDIGMPAAAGRESDDRFSWSAPDPSGVGVAGQPHRCRLRDGVDSDLFDRAAP